MSDGITRRQFVKAATAAAGFALIYPLRTNAQTTQPAENKTTGHILKLQHKAMATMFEIYAFDALRVDLERAGEAAFAEIDALEQKLSYFISSSDISQINALQGGQLVVVSGSTFECLQAAYRAYERTGGTFDPTIGPVLRNRKSWTSGAVTESRGTLRIGMNLLKLGDTQCSVTATVDNVRIDLGGIGKGFAADAASKILVDYGIEAAMIVAGQSTMVPIGVPRGEKGWVMAIRDPRNETDVLKHMLIRNTTLSASSVAKDKHILDPRTGQPVQHHLGTWVTAPTGAESDALSTAFTVMHTDKVEQYCRDHPETSAMVFTTDAKLRSFGKWQESAAKS